MEHVTPDKSDLHLFKKFNPPGEAEISDGKFITIEGMGMVMGHSLLVDGKKPQHVNLKVLHVPEASKWFFLFPAR